MPVNPFLPTAARAGSAPALARILPFAAYLFFLFAADMLARLDVEAQQLRWLYPCKIGAVLALLLFFRRSYPELAWRGMRPRLAALAVAAGLLVFALWISLDAGWMKLGSSPGFDPGDGAGGIDWTLAALRIGGAMLVVPVMEELFWRSFLLRWMASPDFQAVNPRQVGYRAFVVTVLLFGFEHDLWLAGIVAGAVYSLLYMRGGNLWAAILAHGVTNGVLGIWIVATGNWNYW
ncbi:MAG: CAAX prenyl protease-related protein [Pseudomonadota bacterium]